MGNEEKLIKHITLPDPLSGENIPALSLGSKDGLEFITIPDRALDIYRLRYQGVTISHTNEKAGISPRNFTEQGVEGFGRNFFVGFLTTCGLCNAGRPCEENGYSFGLHGCISNTPCTNIEVWEENRKVTVRGIADELHEEGVHMRLSREITADMEKSQLFIRDTVENCSSSPQPYMMMYHINFGAPFLSEKLLIDGQFSYIENRDTGCLEKKEQLLRIGAPGSEERESVYYTRSDMERGITLYNPDQQIQALLCAKGNGLEWMGIWKNFLLSPYAIGIEPCVCPGLGRVNARKRGVLVTLLPNEKRENIVSLSLNKL
ncbi:DUF4432 family protein [Lachnospiraceae bacterium]|nr:DUF4432 family protein [Lachnospiraceae bacterium]